MPPPLGELVNGKYRLVRQLGEGGMGSVFEAFHEGLRARVALKFLHTEFSRPGTVLDRFLQEARLVASIKSPHVVLVNDVETTAGGGELFMVLEYLEGRTLERLLADMRSENQTIPREEALLLSAQMLEGADAAHRAGIVHRDLKPANVMIIAGPHGEPFVKILDFGIAKLRVAGATDGPNPPPPELTRPGVVMGTPEYMAPEQAFSSDLVDARADVFALGVILYEMLSGQRPAEGGEPRAIAAAHLAGKVTRLDALVPDLPPGLADVVHRALAGKASDRYASAGELLAAIEPFASDALSALATTAFSARAAIRGGTALMPVTRGGGTTALPASRGGTTALPHAQAGTTALPASGELRPSQRPTALGPPSAPAGSEPSPTTRPAQIVNFDVPSPREGPAMPPPLANGAVAWTPGAAAAQPPPPQPSRSLFRSKGFLLAVVVGALAVVTAVALGVWIAWPRSAADDEPDVRRTRRPPHAVPHRPAPRRR